MTTEFDVIRAMQSEVHKQETEASEGKLVNDGTWCGLLESYEAMSVDRLPAADVKGYRLCFNVDENGTPKRLWFNVYATPVHNQKGLVIQSTLAAKLAIVLNMLENETYEQFLTRVIGQPVMLRVQKKAAANGYKAGNAVWAITAPKVG